MSAFRVAALLTLGMSLSVVRADDWIFDNAPYARDAKTGERVEQYQKPKTPKRIDYYKFFSPEGPHPYIPYQFYEDELGWPGFFGGEAYGTVPYYGGFGYSTGAMSPYGYAGPYGF